MSLIARVRSLFIDDAVSLALPRHNARRKGRALYLEALEARELFSVDPVITSFSTPIVVNHSGNFTFATAEFTAHYSDPGNLPLASIIIDTLPTQGNLTLGNATVTAGESITAANIPTLVYTPNNSYAGADDFTWDASDGTNQSNSAAVVNFTVMETAPVIGNITLSTSHSNPITFTAADFTGSYSDAESDALASITIVSLPLHGNLLLNGSPVTVNTVVTAANVPNLEYIPATAYKGADTFLWNANDGILNSAKNASVNITVQETAPTVTSFASVPGENESVSFLNGNSSFFALNFSDPDAGDSLQAVKVLSLPSHGTLTLSNGNTTTLVTKNQILSTDDIQNLVYTPTANFTGNDSFNWSASDGTLYSTNSATANLSVRYFTIVANDAVIANGEKTANATDFTDFGYDSTTIGSPSVTRTYTINDIGSLPLNLTGSSLVQISGSNAADFSVTAEPTGNLTSGDSTSFTITFTPNGTGTRNATVTIANNIPGQSPFTFAIKGTGVSTGTTDDGLMLGQIQGGSGNQAASLDTLLVNYTGTLLDGTVFDTTLKAGAQPLQFTLGEGQVIPGWDEGLVGIKTGETRLLIIPPALGYGTTGCGSVPGNATMIFSVTAVAEAKAKLILTGNNVLMNSGSNSVSTQNGTQFGTLPAGCTTLTNTFIITDGGGGVLGFPSSGPAVTVTGADASDFFASTISFASDGSNASFTVTFQPTAPGTRNAIIDVQTNDPTHPNFTFAVQGTILYTDLSASLGTLTLPPAPTTVGGNTTLTLPVVVTNMGGLQVPKTTPNATITVSIQDNVKNVTLPLQTFTNQNVTGLGINQSRTFNEKITIPNGFDIDNATITATIVAAALNPIVETDTLNPSVVTTNNTVTSTLTSDITGVLVSTSLPPQVVAGAKENGNVTFQLKNSGNAVLPSSQKVYITVTAVPTGGGAAIPLGELTNQSIGSLAAGATKNFTVNIPSNTLFPTGTYTIAVLVTLTPSIPGEQAGNNDITVTAANAPLSITASAPFQNITGSLVSSTLPTSGGNTGPLTGNVTVQVINAANSALPSGEKVQIELFAHNLTEDVPDVLLATSTAQSISSWAPNKSQNFPVPVNYTAGLLIDNYQIEAELVPEGPVITESSVLDNTITTKADGTTTIGYTSETPANDFTVNTVTSSIPSKSGNQSLKGNVSVRIENAGNIPMPNPQHVTIQIVAQPSTSAATDHSADVVLAISTPESIANLAPGAALTFSVPVNFATGLPTGSYTIEALIAPVETLNPAELNVLDNYGTVTTGNVALTLTIT